MQGATFGPHTSWRCFKTFHSGSDDVHSWTQTVTTYGLNFMALQCGPRARKFAGKEGEGLVCMARGGGRRKRMARKVYVGGGEKEDIADRPNTFSSSSSPLPTTLSLFLFHRQSRMIPRLSDHGGRRAFVYATMGVGEGKGGMLRGD